MPTKPVYSIRVPEQIRKLMKEMKDIDWQKEIRTIVEEIFKKKRKERLLFEEEKVRKGMKAINAAELIREDRDAR